AGIFFYVATGVVFALNTYILTFVWQLSNVQIFILSLSTFLAVLIGFVVAIPVSKRFGKRDGGIVMFVVGIAISIVPLLLRLFGVFLHNDSSLLLPALFVFNAIGGGLSIGASIPLVAMRSEEHTSELQSRGHP